MQIHGHDIGVCSWSLQPRDARDLVAKVKALGLEHVQLSLIPFLNADPSKRDEQIAALRDSGLNVTAGMIGFAGEDYTSIASIRKTGGFVPDARYDERRDYTLRAAKLCAELGLKSFSAHAGFIPNSNSPDYEKIVRRLGEVADLIAPFNVTLMFETGQETASELLQYLNDLTRKNVKVNFDPANMVLYGAGDPIDAIRILGRHIGHVHLKDAISSDTPQLKWGTEVPFGTGQVNPAKLLGALDSAGYKGPLVFEREAGETQSRDIQSGIEALRAAG
jgi:sugar phosphate isomerase/epimerase